MKRFLLLAFIVLFCFSCTRPNWSSTSVSKQKNITVEQAKQYYEQHCSNRYTRSNIDERLPFVIGDAEWLWDKAEESTLNDQSAVDIPISGGYSYKVYRKQASGEYLSVNTSSKIVAVQENGSEKISFYIRVSIPDVTDDDAVNRTLNFENRGIYNGLEYYVTLDGCPAAVAKYKDGELVDALFLGDKKLGKLDKLCKFADMLRGLCISRYDATRNGADFDCGEVGYKFMDQFGNIYVTVDTDNDGIADAVCPIFSDDIEITAHFQSNGGNNIVGSTDGGNSANNTGNSGGSANGGSNGGGSGGSGSGSGSGSNNNSNSSKGNSNTSNNNNDSPKDRDATFDDALFNKDWTVIEAVGDMVNPIDVEFVLNPLKLPSPEIEVADVRAELLKLLTYTNPVAEFIRDNNIPILDCSATTYDVKTLAADGQLKVIYCNMEYYNRLSYHGRLLAVFHEYMHFYLNSDSHELMINNLNYQQALRNIFPGETAYFYEAIQFVGCYSITILKNIEDDTRQVINSTIYK